jgi:hypothetical protein
VISGQWSVAKSIQTCPSAEITESVHPRTFVHEASLMLGEEEKIVADT